MGRNRAHIWFVGPAVLLMIVLLILPVFVAAALSFTDYSLGNSSFDWVGTKNYDALFSRSSYAKMFSASLTYVLLVVPISVALGLGSALLISSLRIGGELYKAVFFLPVMATLLAMAIVWEFALHPIVGIVNDVLSAGCDIGWLHALLSGSWLGRDPLSSWYGDGCADSFPLWLGDKDYALGTIAFIGIWQGFGFNMVLYLAGLTSVPRELYQAAQMDGADSAWERFKLVTWPMLGPTNVFVITISSIRSFQVFDTVEALTRGGPSKSTYVMIYAMFEKGVKQNLLGIGSAITIIFLGFVLILTLIQVYFVNRKVHYG
ncbi:carbohydrate ABC transporter permease [uncultured Roseovarius sp.]|uniref:carbohydrate ABC transporter permease n=1 Tax=uncultured Roseovarius sp. TaxID=293344 RepID=UPI002631FF0A|nr:sugar ABC transporter permease [uncultured Roseovarius sp.]